MEHIVQNLVNSLRNVLSNEVIVFLISMLPIVELRGGVFAASLLRIDWHMALPICIIGNLLPIPFILLFIKKIFEFLKNTRLVKFINKLENRAEQKSASVLKYKKFGLFLFVAIPIPGTGAWMGALIAALLNMNIKDAFISIALGVISAGLIMAILSYGVLGLFI